MFWSQLVTIDFSNQGEEFYAMLYNLFVAGLCMEVV